MPSVTLHDLVALSNRLGRPENDYVILGEGNTSARIDDDSFWVKASGSELRSVGESGFVAVTQDRVLDLLSAGEPSDEQIIEALVASKVDRHRDPRPSVETLMHAICLDLPGVSVVAHTHPTAINSLTCSKDFERAIAGRTFPDEIVVCGAAPCVVPYVDPGLPLARAVQRRISEYRNRFNTPPKVILLQNHGLVALGPSCREVENITAMAVKSARILLGTAAFGGPNFLSQQHVERIQSRTDEHYRQRIIGGQAH